MADQDSNEIGAADSMEAAVAMLAKLADPSQRLSETQLKRAKAAGCQAFRGSRVYLEELLAWWDENADTLPTGDAALDALNKEIAQEKLRKVRFENDAKEGLYLPRAEYGDRLLALGQEIKGVLRRKLEDEYPDRLAMKPREEVLRLNRQLVDELCLMFQEGATKCLKTH